jgi:hydroxymethylpyrimidine/phosphomethylpyrimidine kinase
MSRPTSRLLIIAGSDPGGGAGLQADIKTAAAFGVYAMTAVTAVTVQDTTEVYSVHNLPAALVRDQITVCLKDIGVDAIKIGMLGDGDIALAVAETLEAEDSGTPLILDPVLAASDGTAFLDSGGIKLLEKRLLPLAALVTPNLPETERLVGILPCSEEDFRQAAERFAGFGCPNTLFKGGHGDGPILRDVLVDANSGVLTYFDAPRQDSRHTHGTGCTLSTAIACGLALDWPFEEAVRQAHAFVQSAIRTAPGLGGGRGPLNHFLRAKTGNQSGL